MNTNHENRIEIPLSRKKLILLILGALILVVASIFGTITPETFTSPLFRNPEVIRIISSIGLGFFGICLGFIVKKFFDKNVGLIIDKSGITDHSSATSVGLIPWEDIKSFKTIQVASTKILIIQVRTPKNYIKFAKNRFIKHVMIMNMKKYGSPLYIISSSLQIRFDELESLLRTEFDKYKSK